MIQFRHAVAFDNTVHTQFLMHMPASKNLHVLTKIRDGLSLSQQALAREVGVHWRTIQDVECGKRKLSQRLARDISEATGVSQEWLLSNDASRPPVNRDGKKYRFAHDREKAVLSKSEWLLYSKIEREQALAVCLLLFRQYRVHRCLLDRLPNTYATWAAFDECITTAVMNFRKTYPAAREAWPSRLWKDSPWVASRKKTLKDVWRDLKELSDSLKEPEIPPRLQDEKMLLQILLPICGTRKERVRAVKFIRAKVDAGHEHDLGEMTMVELKAEFRRGTFSTKA